MKPRAGWLLGLAALLVTAAGCQCSPCYEPYNDLIDDLGEHECCLDHWYHPTLDVSRIGHPDWCSCEHNRRFCPCECNPYWKEFGPAGVAH